MNYCPKEFEALRSSQGVATAIMYVETVEAIRRLMLQMDVQASLDHSPDFWNAVSNAINRNETFEENAPNLRWHSMLMQVCQIFSEKAQDKIDDPFG